MSEERIRLARTALILKHPFFGSLATRMKLVETTAEKGGVSTMAVDGRKMYYCMDFVNKLSDKELMFVVAHEVMHLVFEHLERRDERNPLAWNIACDYAVNLVVKDQNIGEMPKDVLYDEKYRGMTSEEIYQKLKNKAKKDLDKLAEKMLDEHLTAGSEKDPMTPEERRQMKDEIKEAIINAAKQCEPGQVPGEVQRMIDELNNPKVDWKGVLRANIEGLFKNNYSYLKPHRKFMSAGLIMPGAVRSPSVNITVAIDTSGSIGPVEYTAFLSEVKGITDAFTDFKLTILGWNTRVSDVKEYDAYSLEDVTTWTTKDSGGTDPNCIFDWIEDNNVESDTVVVLTDGEFSAIDRNANKRVLWCVYGKKDNNHIQGGEVLEIDSFN